MPVHIVHGEDEKEAFAWLSRKKEEWIPPAWRSFNFHRVDARKISFDEFSGMVQAYPMGSDYRVVVVEGLEKSDLLKNKELPSLLSTLLPSTNLVLWFVPGPSTAKKLPFGAAWKEVLARADYQRVSSDSGLSEGATVFSLLDALGERKASKALLVLKELFLQGEPPLRILATIANQIRILWQIKVLGESGKSKDEIAKRLGIHPYRITKGLQQVRNFKATEFPRMIEWLTRADWNLKTGKNEPDHLLVLLLLRICKG